MYVAEWSCLLGLYEDNIEWQSEWSQFIQDQS